jgi:hypothetical protein
MNQIRSRSRAACALRVAFVFALLGFGSCSMTAPTGFVPVTPQRGRDFEALSAAGEIFTVSRYDSPEEATIEFWITAIQRELIEERGYELISAQDVSSKGGRRGHELWMRTPEALGDQRYFVTIFVEERWGQNYVHVIEAAGPSDLMERHLTSIREAAAINF